MNQPQHQPAISGHLAVGGLSWRAPAQLAGRAAELLAHDVIELPDAGESARKGHVCHRQGGLVDEQPGCLSPTGPGEGKRPDPNLRGQQPMQVTLADGQAGGQARDAPLVDLARCDEPQRSSHQVGPVVPLAGPRQSIRAAALACPEPRGHSSGRARVEPNVLRQRGPRGT